MGALTPFELARLTPDMSSRALQVLAFIRAYHAQWGIAPSQREMANGMDVSRAVICRALASLERQQLIVRVAGERGIVLPEERDAALRVLTRLGWWVAGPDESLLPPPDLDYLPVD